MRRQLGIEELGPILGTSRGGFTLWLGAGASIALSSGSSPGWAELVQQLAPSPDSPNFADLPAELERVSQTIGHRAFRIELRRRLVAVLVNGAFDTDLALSQAVVGARAGQIVSFNLEFISAWPFTLMKGGAATPYRTFRERSAIALDIRPELNPGVVKTPVYFPHGLLMEGNIVMTASEYIRHMGGLAVTTAVHLALGGDLVVLGMSFGDPYLREAILHNRRWLGEVYWLNQQFAHREWARVADATCVQVSHQHVWDGLTKAFLEADSSGTMEEARSKLTSELPVGLAKTVDSVRSYPTKVLDHIASQILNSPLPRDHASLYLRFCHDSGIEDSGDTLAQLEAMATGAA